MKKLLAVFLIISSILLPNGVWAANVKSTQLLSAFNQYWSITNAAQTGLGVTGALTLQTYIYNITDPGTDVEYPIITKWGAGTDLSYLLDYVNDAGTPTINFTIRQSGASKTISYVTTLSSLTFYQITTVFDPNVGGGTMTIYINGSSVASAGSKGTTVDATAAGFRVGSVERSGNNANSIIDEVRVWNIALSSAQITANYNCGLSAPQTGLQGLWNFDGSNGNDSTANANNLTNNNTATFSTTLPFSNACASGSVHKDFGNLIFFN